MDKKIDIDDVKKLEYGYTHAGVFHADDIFSAALLKLINPEIRIVRTFDPPKDRNSVIFDIGGGRYDHHGKQEYRPALSSGTEIPYASFGKLWRDLGLDICEGYEEAFKAVDRDLISEMDWTDCTGCSNHYNTLSIAISAMNPTSEEVAAEGNIGRNRRFDDAVKIAIVILKRIIDGNVSKAKSVKKLSKITVANHILLLDEYMPWKDFIVKRNQGYKKSDFPVVYFAVYPSLRGGYNIETVPSGSTDNSVLVPFPKEWWGAPEDKLPDGITFCHASGFLAATKSKEVALAVASSLILTAHNTYLSLGQ